jgi:hypothetical protein
MLPASPHPYEDLTPDVVLDAMASVGLNGDGRLTALSSYENRVYQAGLEAPAGETAALAVVLKFYRPGRWSRAQIQEEHDFAAELVAAEVPVVAGIMPFHNYARIAQFAQRDGIDIPRWVALKMEGYMDDAASIRAFGLDVVTRLCERLIAGGAPALHFYALNQSELVLEIGRRLGLAKN